MGYNIQIASGVRIVSSLLFNSPPHTHTGLMTGEGREQAEYQFTCYCCDFDTNRGAAELLMKS